MIIYSLNIQQKKNWKKHHKKCLLLIIIWWTRERGTIHLEINFRTYCVFDYLIFYYVNEMLHSVFFFDKMKIQCQIAHTLRWSIGNIPLNIHLLCNAISTFVRLFSTYTANDFAYLMILFSFLLCYLHFQPYLVIAIIGWVGLLEL